MAVMGVVLTIGRAPHGARGLKFQLINRYAEVIGVAPRTGRVD